MSRGRPVRDYSTENVMAASMLSRWIDEAVALAEASEEDDDFDVHEYFRTLEATRPAAKRVVHEGAE